MGAVGGALFGLSLIGAKVVRGAKFIMGLLDFELKAKEADFIITGEGKISENTKYGKVVWEVMQFGKSHKITVITITGKVERSDTSECLHTQGLTKVFPINRDNQISREYSISHTPELLQNTGGKGRQSIIQ